MNKVKSIVASLLFVALAIIATSFSAIAPSTSKQCVTKYFSWTGTTSSHPDFLLLVSGGSSTTFINVSGNWTSESISEPTCTPPEQTLCAIKVEVCAGMFPSKQSILDKVKEKLEELLGSGQTFTNNYNFSVTINSVSVSITIFNRSNPD
jgi:hypothetical protein